MQYATIWNERFFCCHLIQILLHFVGGLFLISYGILGATRDIVESNCDFGWPMQSEMWIAKCRHIIQNAWQFQLQNGHTKTERRRIGCIFSRLVLSLHQIAYKRNYQLKLICLTGNNARNISMNCDRWEVHWCDGLHVACGCCIYNAIIVNLYVKITLSCTWHSPRTHTHTLQIFVHVRVHCSIKTRFGI